MKKFILFLIPTLIFAACEPTEFINTITPEPPQPIENFAEVECNDIEHPESFAVQWEWMKFQLPWCWAATVMDDADQPLLVLQDMDESGGGMITFTYDPNVDNQDLQVVQTNPSDPDTLLIMNTLEEL